jgi:hypothetical protein
LILSLALGEALFLWGIEKTHDKVNILICVIRKAVAEIFFMFSVRFLIPSNIDYRVILSPTVRDWMFYNVAIHYKA